MSKIKITSMEIKNLKGLKNVRISFDKSLTAIMGVNGSGKSTIIHALACCFSPENKDWGEDRKFSYFFTPNTNASWKNSYFKLFFKDLNKNPNKVEERLYHKDSDRWAPRYRNRPIRNTIYLGIDTCLPEIELSSRTTRIEYNTNYQKDKCSKKIIDDASFILNRQYTELTLNKTNKNNRSLIGVETSNGLKYSSLSMASGEQRILKILKAVHTAPCYSMILIDEIDLLLHPSALKRLIKILDEISKNKNLQIIFTTHSLLMNSLTKFVNIQFLEDTPSKTLVYDYMSLDATYLMTETMPRPIKIYVEDNLSSAIISSIASSLNYRKYIEIKKFGSIENAFTIASGIILKGEDPNKNLIVLDGDKYTNNKEKMKRIKKVLSGTEMDIEEKQNAALKIITQYNSLKEESPEITIHTILCKLENNQSEIIKAARNINVVKNPHDWINKIIEQINEPNDIIIYKIIELIHNSSDWNIYVKPIADWLKKHCKNL